MDQLTNIEIINLAFVALAGVVIFICLVYFVTSISNALRKFIRILFKEPVKPKKKRGL